MRFPIYPVCFFHSFIWLSPFARDKKCEYKSTKRSESANWQFVLTLIKYSLHQTNSVWEESACFGECSAELMTQPRGSYIKYWIISTLKYCVCSFVWFFGKVKRKQWFPWHIHHSLYPECHNPSGAVHVQHFDGIAIKMVFNFNLQKIHSVNSYTRREKLPEQVDFPLFRFGCNSQKQCADCKSISNPF